MNAMNSLSSLPKFTPLNLSALSSLHPFPISRKHGKKQTICCSYTHKNMKLTVVPKDGRREAVIQMVAFVSAFPCIVSEAVAAEAEAELDYQLYKDETDKFSLFVPQDWVQGKGKADGQRSVTAFYPENDEVSNVNIIITGLGPDYTRMESFGTVDAFAETLVNGLDRSWKRPPGLAAKLLNAKSKNGMYYVEYSLQKPGESKIHLFSAVGMAFNGWYNRLYTATGQYLEENGDKYKSKIEKSISSFKII